MNKIILKDVESVRVTNGFYNQEFIPKHCSSEIVLTLGDSKTLSVKLSHNQSTWSYTANVDLHHGKVGMMNGELWVSMADLYETVCVRFESGHANDLSMIPKF